MANFNSTQDITIWSEDGAKSVTVTTDGAKERLDVDATILRKRPGRLRQTFGEYNGSAHLNVDGSSTPVVFEVVPEPGKLYYISRIVFTIEDVGINFNKFGGRVELTNGCEFKVKEGGLAERSTTPFTRNADFSLRGYEVVLQSSTTDLLSAVQRLNEWNSTFELSDARGDYVHVVVNDNLTSITNFTFLVNGYEVDE